MYSVYTLLKVVSYYDLSVLSMSVMGFQKKKFGWVGWWGELYPSFFWDFWNFVNFAKPLMQTAAIVKVRSDKVGVLLVLAQLRWWFKHRMVLTQPIKPRLLIVGWCCVILCWFLVLVSNFFSRHSNCLIAFSHRFYQKYSNNLCDAEVAQFHKT